MLNREKLALKHKIIELIETDEEDHYSLPQYGLIADWRLRYLDLRSLVIKYIQAD